MNGAESDDEEFLKDLFSPASPKATEYWENHLEEEARKKAEFEEEIAEKDKEWLSMKNQARRDADKMEKERAFFTEAGLDAKGHCKGWMEEAAEACQSDEEAAEPAAELIKDVLRNAGIDDSFKVSTKEPIRLCPLTTHKPKAVSNLEGRDHAYEDSGYRKVRVTFDTGAGESVTPPGEFQEFDIKESEGSRKG